MLFLVFENQLLLVISLFFSACLFVNSLAIKRQPAKLRAFGLAFAIPLILNISAFFTSPYQESPSSSVFLLGHLLPILTCTIILLVNECSPILKLFYLIPFVLVWAACIYSGSSLYSAYFAVFYIIDAALVLINLTLVFNSIFQKNKWLVPAHTGLFMLAAALGIWLYSKAVTIEADIIAALGYCLCTIYYYRNMSEHQKGRQ